jgi:hypothetical protein
VEAESPILVTTNVKEITMDKRFCSLALASVLAVGLATAGAAKEAPNIVPDKVGVTTDLGNRTSALTYWVDEAQGLRVVTTIDSVTGEGSGSPHHSVVRFSALILPGQSQVISAPGPVEARPPMLQIRRLSNQDGRSRIQVQRIDAASHSS